MKKLLKCFAFSVRRASVLAYIASLELRTLPVIDHELGLTDGNEDIGPFQFKRPEPLDPATPYPPPIQETPATTGPSPS